MATKRKQYVVKTEATVVHANTVEERYLYRGAGVPDSVTDEEIKWLLEINHIGEVGDVVTAPADAPDAPAGV